MKLSLLSMIIFSLFSFSVHSEEIPKNELDHKKTSRKFAQEDFSENSIFSKCGFKQNCTSAPAELNFPDDQASKSPAPILKRSWKKGGER